ncbi:putative RNA methyltransferase, partial [Proteus faecis]|uniref:putative RNA methyltransferase n=1 Tax=Proteus faecis TaxID=2050967 RepID=UPI003D806DB2
MEYFSNIGCNCLLTHGDVFPQFWVNCASASYIYLLPIFCFSSSSACRENNLTNSNIKNNTNHYNVTVKIRSVLKNTQNKISLPNTFIKFIITAPNKNISPYSTLGYTKIITMSYQCPLCYQALSLQAHSWICENNHQFD